MYRVASPAAAHLGANLRAARVEQDKTVDQVAALTGINSSNVRAYEAGRRLTNLYALVRVAHALEVEPNELLAGLTPEMFKHRTET